MDSEADDGWTNNDVGSTATEQSVAPESNPEDTWRRGDKPVKNTVADISVIPFDDLHIHRYCDVFPVKIQALKGEDGVQRSDGNHRSDRSIHFDVPWLGYGIEVFPSEDELTETSCREIRYLPTRKDALEGSPIWGIFTGCIRTALRYTPFVIGTVMLLLVIFSEYSPKVVGISTYLAAIPMIASWAIVGGTLLWGFLLYLLIGAGLIDASELLQAIAVYGLVGFLTIGTAGSIFLVFTASDPRSLPPNIIYTSGYLLVVLVGGLLTYDGMLRTEYLFNNIDKKLIVDDTKKYAAYRKQIAENLSDTTYIPILGQVPTYILFAVVLVSQFAGVWFLTDGPQSLGLTLTFVMNVFFDLVMSVIYFQLFVLIKGFHDLITGNVKLDIDNSQGDDPRGSEIEDRHDLISYYPFHPDGHGGFRDFGRFATRVNGLLLLGGLYVIYRLYIQGARAFPANTDELITQPTVEIMVWAVSYIGPVIVLTIVAFAWLYYSFWTLHVKMSYERELHYTDHLQRKRAENDSTPIGSVEDGKAWQETRNPAPVWPVDARILVSSLSSGLVPLVLALPRFII